MGCRKKKSGSRHTLSGNIECKPFKKTHTEQLKLVTSFDWIDFDKLSGAQDEIRQVFDQAGDYMDEARKTAILSAFSSRLRNLMMLSEVQCPMDDIEQDAQQDIAVDYGIKMDM